MTGELLSPDEPADIRVVYDRRVWLRGPTTDVDLEDWSAAAAREVIDRFDEADEERDHSLTQLTAMVRRFVGAKRPDVSERFLLTGDLSITPVIAEMYFTVGLPEHVAAENVLRFDTDQRYYDPPRGTVVDERSGLVRIDRALVDEHGRLAVLRRYHRRVQSMATDIVVVSDGADLRAATLAQPLLDSLVASVRVIGPDGQEW